jgi:DNA-binding Lrp family transcriptional regulator
VEVQGRLRAIPEVEHMALVGGDFDVILLVRASDARDLRRIVLEDIQAIPSIRSTRTTLIFEDFGRD